MSLSAAFAQGLSLDSQRGSVGETITFTVQVDHAPNAVQALGFSVHYDPQVLRYTGVHAAGELTSGFEYFAANAPIPGQVRVGGFTTRQPVAAGSSGRLVTLEFQVLRPGDATVSLAQPVDHIATWPVQAGRFTHTTSPLQNQQDNTALAPSRASPEPSTSLPTSPSAVPLPAAPAQPTAEPPAATPQRRASPPPAVPRSTSENAVLPQVPTAQDKGVTQQPDPAEKASTAKLSPTVTPAAETSTSQRPSPSDSVTTHTQQPAQEGTTAFRSPRESAVSPPGKGPNPPSPQAKGDTDPASEPFLQNFRIVVPIVAMVLLGVIIVALVSMKRPD